MTKSLPIIRTSERRDFLRCQQRWYWSWREGLRPLGPPSVALWFGSLVHDALAAYYLPGLKRGPHPAETFSALAGEEEQHMKISEKMGNGEHSLTEETLVDARALGIAMLEGYVAHWEKKERSRRVIKPEQTFQLYIPHPRNPGKMIAINAGTYDLVYEEMDTEEIWLGEHKTAKAVILDHLPLDPQAGGYWAVASIHLVNEGLMRKGQKIRGIEYNFLRKAMPDVRPRNALGLCTNKPTKAHYVEAFQGMGVDTLDGKVVDKCTLADLQYAAENRGLTVLGEPSLNQPRPLFVREKVNRTAKERQSQITRLQNEAMAMKPLREPGATLLKNPTRDCQWDCSHYAMCLLHEQGGDVQAYREAAYQVQDPYADHRKTTEGDD
jgi:hypothetical protein